jgi:hypothetical protein
MDVPALVPLSEDPICRLSGPGEALEPVTVWTLVGPSNGLAACETRPAPGLDARLRPVRTRDTAAKA